MVRKGGLWDRPGSVYTGISHINQLFLPWSGDSSVSGLVSWRRRDNGLEIFPNASR
jgi:hypothetical protein